MRRSRRATAQDQQRIFDAYRKAARPAIRRRARVNREVGAIQLEIARRNQEVRNLRELISGLEGELGLTLPRKPPSSGGLLGPFAAPGGADILPILYFAPDAHQSSQRKRPMLYELRTYTCKQGTVADVAKAASTLSLDIRKDDYGKLEGYWVTEIGPLNQVMHMWSYKDLNHRAEMRAALSKNPRWGAEYLPVIYPNIVKQETRLMHAVVGPKVPATTPNVYELRVYRAAAGKMKGWVDLFTSALEVREKYSRLSGCGPATSVSPTRWFISGLIPISTPGPRRAAAAARTPAGRRS